MGGRHDSNVGSGLRIEPDVDPQGSVHAETEGGHLLDFGNEVEQGSIGEDEVPSFEAFATVGKD
eukprot:15461118-Alexandrium_andersonii.AAC.1